MKTEEERRPGGIGKLKRSQTAELEETAERKAGRTAKPEKAGGGQTGETAEIQGDGKRKGAGSFSRIVLRRAAADVISIKWAILLIGVCFLALWAATGSICPMVAFTGFPCPGCGLTRAGLLALSLDFPGAWKMNPFIFPIGALILIWCVYRYIVFRKPPVWFTRCAAAVLTGLVLFYVWRMICCFPRRSAYELLRGSSAVAAFCSLEMKPVGFLSRYCTGGESYETGKGGGCGSPQKIGKQGMNMEGKWWGKT